MNFDKKIKLHKTLKRMQWRKTVKLPRLSNSRDFVDNAYSGSGIYYFSQDEDGDVFRYEGECRDGTYNGKGKMFLNDQLGRAI